jgi:hypothetical protein
MVFLRLPVSVLQVLLPVKAGILLKPVALLLPLAWAVLLA